jgi:tetratricopeptide (TPR) repeat protein
MSAGEDRTLPSGRRGTAALMLAVAAMLFTGSVLVQAARDTRYGDVDRAGMVLYVRSGAAAQRLSLWFDALAADVYWIRAIQYYGGTKLSSDSGKTYDLLYPLLDVATTLDPQFHIAYRFGAIFLAEGYPDGAGRPDLAVALLEKGVRAQPEKWQYLQDIGFVHYWWLRDYELAAEWFQRASEVPGAPWWLRSMAATVLAEGGDRDRSRMLWRQLHDTADNDWLRSSAVRRLAQLDALDQIDHLEALVRRYESAAMRRATWEGLVRAGLLRGIPVDPSGAPYVIDADSGAVTISSDSTLHPLPVDRQGTPRTPPDA